MDMPTTSKNVSDPARGCEDLVLSSAFWWRLKIYLVILCSWGHSLWTRAMGCSDSDLDSRGSLARNVSVIRDRLCVCLSRQTGVRTPCRSSCHASGKHSLPPRLQTRTCLSSFSQSQSADNDIPDIIFGRFADVKLDATLTSDLKWDAAQALPIQGYPVDH